MSDLFSSLNDLKAKLNLIEQETFGNTNLEQQQELQPDCHIQEKNLKGKISQIQRNQKNVVVLDVRGEKTQVSRVSIENCLYENILMDELKLNDADLESKPIFLDFSRKCIKEILQILRFFCSSSAAKKYKIFVQNKEGEEFLVKEILSFFKNPSILNSLEFNY